MKLKKKKKKLTCHTNEAYNQMEANHKNHPIPHHPDLRIHPTTWYEIASKKHQVLELSPNETCPH